MAIQAQIVFHPFFSFLPRYFFSPAVGTLQNSSGIGGGVGGGGVGGVGAVGGDGSDYGLCCCDLLCDPRERRIGFFSNLEKSAANFKVKT